ncbi:MAG: TraB/GumN family protein, partial [Chitinophagaceae bacterium]
SKYDLGNSYGYSPYGMSRYSNSYFLKSSLLFSRYIPSLERALSGNPSSINNLLYRSYGNDASDFEEDTYLDMYIYQCGKKWGKKVAGVEHYGESMKLMGEAYQDAMKDRGRKTPRYDRDDDYSSGKLQEAYRTGNLDWLDTINKYNSQSEAFDEKFMYRRNEIQSSNIDSILKTGQSLFVGVGAAHLPGNRGVIEMLRRMGYKLRPVKMGARDSDHKTQVEKIRVPVNFTTRYARDSFFRADIPGKFYPGEGDDHDELQYADMANGSYYRVMRIETNSWMWGQSTQRVRAVADSLLYENIPGRIVKKSVISRDGYPGIEIVNRTRRGDMQRYNLYITPYEILVFKMSGTGDYVTLGTEADRFFSSIRLKNYPPATAGNWKKFSPRYGGFEVSMPHEPFAANRSRWTFDATDSSTGTNYRVIRNDVHNFWFTDQDSFDLSMMDESFASSEFIDKKLSSGYGYTNGYPSLDAKYRDKSGAVYRVRFLIQGAHYYTILSRAPKESAAQAEFINSFSIQPFRYGNTQPEKDTTLKFTVRTPWIDRTDKEKINIPSGYSWEATEDEPGTGDGSLSRVRMVANDSTGEVISVSYSRISDYETVKDSSLLLGFNRDSWKLDSARIVRSSQTGTLPGGVRYSDVVLSDSGSSRQIRMKLYYVNGNAFMLMNQSDTLTQASSFVNNFFDSFQPADSLKGTDPFASKTTRFFSDFFSSDTILHKKAVRGIDQLVVGETDLDNLNKAISTLSYKEKSYIDLKKTLLDKLSDLKSPKASDLLKYYYNATADTLELQYASLSGLLSQKTEYAFRIFRDLVVADPPVISGSTPYVNYSGTENMVYSTDAVMPSTGTSFLYGLRDSLQLTLKILPDLLPLMNLDDYEPRLRTLLGMMADSNLIKPKLLEPWYNKMMLQAKQQLKKKLIGEKQAQIATAELQKDRRPADDYYDASGTGEEYSASSTDLDVYVSVLLPFYDKQPQVRSFIAQLFAGNDEMLKYEILKRMIHHGKPYPDTMLNHFASLDKYRFRLYQDLKEMDRSTLFPVAQKTQLSLARSLLLQRSPKPDTLVYLTRMDAKVGKQEGVVLFFKYKMRKDDVVWKIANVGLMPSDGSKLEFADADFASAWSAAGGYQSSSYYDYEYGGRGYQMGAPGSTKINEELSLDEQLKKELKRILFSTHKSGQMFFYGSDGDEEQYADSVDVIAEEN